MIAIGALGAHFPCPSVIMTAPIFNMIDIENSPRSPLPYINSCIPIIIPFPKILAKLVEFLSVSDRSGINANYYFIRGAHFCSKKAQVYF